MMENSGRRFEIRLFSSRALSRAPQRRAPPGIFPSCHCEPGRSLAWQSASPVPVSILPNEVIP